MISLNYPLIASISMFSEHFRVKEAFRIENVCIFGEVYVQISSVFSNAYYNMTLINLNRCDKMN